MHCKLRVRSLHSKVLYAIQVVAAACKMLLAWRVFNNGQSALLSSLRTLALLNPLLVRFSHSSCGHFDSDRCEMASVLKGCSLLHMSSFFRQGQLPLLRCSKAVLFKDSLHRYIELCESKVTCFSTFPRKALGGQARSAQMYTSSRS